MRGSDIQVALFTFSMLQDFVPPDRPLRSVRVQVNEGLKRRNGLF